MAGPADRNPESEDDFTSRDSSPRTMSPSERSLQIASSCYANPSSSSSPNPATGAQNRSRYVSFNDSQDSGIQNFSLESLWALFRNTYDEEDVQRRYYELILQLAVLNEERKIIGEELPDAPFLLTVYREKYHLMIIVRSQVELSIHLKTKWNQLNGFSSFNEAKAAFKLLQEKLPIKVDLEKGEPLYVQVAPKENEPPLVDFISVGGRSTIKCLTRHEGRRLTDTPGRFLFRCVDDRQREVPVENIQVSAWVLNWKGEPLNCTVSETTRPAGNIEQNWMRICYERPRLTGYLYFYVLLNGYLKLHKTYIRERRQYDMSENKNDLDYNKIVPLRMFGYGVLEKPFGVAFHGNKIFVTDRIAHQVLVFTMSGTLLRRIGNHGSNPGEFKNPSGIAVDRSGKIIVSDKDNHRIQIFNENGSLIRVFGVHKNVRRELSERSKERDLYQGFLNYPWGIAVDSANNIAVVDGQNGRVQLFDDKGVYMQQTRGGHLVTPRDIVFLEDDRLVVSDFENDLLAVFSPRFEFLTHIGFGPNLDSRNLFYKPNGLAVDLSRRLLYVADSRNYRVLVLSTDTFQITSSFGYKGSDPGEFDTLQGMCIIPSNGLLVTIEMGNLRAQIFQV